LVTGADSGLGFATGTEDLEGIVIYLASDAWAYHAGDVIVIDGGKLITI